MNTNNEHVMDTGYGITAIERSYVRVQGENRPSVTIYFKDEDWDNRDDFAAMVEYMANITAYTDRDPR